MNNILTKNILTIIELAEFANWLESNMLGAQLQKVWTDGELLILECYLNQSYWLCFDLNLQTPLVTIVSSKPNVRKQPKPVSLFLTAHAVNLRFLSFTVDQKRGRVFRAGLGVHENVCELEAWLIPKNVNFFVKANAQGEKTKKISWSKPKDLPPLPSLPEVTEISADVEINDWLAFGDEWLKAKNKPRSASVKHEKINPLEKEFLRSIQKKEKAILEISAQLESHDINLYRQLGEVLKYSSEVPLNLQGLYDPRLTTAENRERAFKKSKDLARKKEGTRARLEILKLEIQALNKKIEKARAGSVLSQGLVLNSEHKKSVANKILQSSESKARKRSFKAGPESDFEAVMGKSAQDNLSILRHARAWDYWLHLRDYPGAHAIIFRNKAQAVPDSIFSEVAQWIVDETISKKQISAGVKYDIILAECRFVKPIKGAMGQVTYQNSRTFTFASK